MTYPVACTDDTPVPTHCGTFIGGTAPAPELPPPLHDGDAEQAVDLTPFGGPLFEAMRSNRIMEL